MKTRKKPMVAGVVAAAALLSGLAAPQGRAVEETSAPETASERLTLLYTVNNLGYTDTCG